MVGGSHYYLRMRARSYCFTSFLDGLEYDESAIRYIIWGREACPDTDRAHLQGYVEFTRGVSLSSAKRLLGDPAVHLEARKGTAAQAVTYCKKDGDYIEWGEPSKQGRRSDIELVRELVGRGEGMRAVLAEASNYQTLSIAKVALTYLEVGRSSAPKVAWFYGATGTGKTRCVVEEAGDPTDVWWANGGLRWFDGYDAHRVAVLDDFRPEWCKLSFLLRLLDRYTMRVEVKGGMRSWLPDEIYITCPKHPGECYLDAGEDIDQLLRRVTVIKEFV